MKLCTFEYEGRKEAGIVRGAVVLPVAEVNLHQGTPFPEELLELIQSDSIEELKTASAGIEAGIPISEVRFRLPYPNPPKVWCIGLNYRSHAEDLQADQPEEPGSFMKPSSALFEPGGVIELPPSDLSSEVDAEGELGLVFGKRCRDVPLELVSEVLLGYTTTHSCPN